MGELRVKEEKRRGIDQEIIGILGGMGPEATLDLFQKIIKNTKAVRDQDHIRVLIDSNPKIPDRTRAILGSGENPLPLMIETARNLERAGAKRGQPLKAVPVGARMPKSR